MEIIGMQKSNLTFDHFGSPFPGRAGFEIMYYKVIVIFIVIFAVSYMMRHSVKTDQIGLSDALMGYLYDETNLV